MDWNAYGDYNDLFKQMEKCHDLLLGFSGVEKKRSIAQILDYKTSKIAFNERAFVHGFVDTMSNKILDHKLMYMKDLDVFEHAFSILVKMNQNDYDKSLEKLDSIAKHPRSEPAFYSEVSMKDIYGRIKRSGYTDVEEYPATIEQFKQETISLLTEKGIEVDMNKVAEEKSIKQALKSFVSTTIECIQTAAILIKRFDDRTFMR